MRSPIDPPSQAFPGDWFVVTCPKLRRRVRSKVLHLRPDGAAHALLDEPPERWGPEVKV